jgi:hypothetical protein
MRISYEEIPRIIDVIKETDKPVIEKEDNPFLENLNEKKIKKKPDIMKLIKEATQIKKTQNIKNKK